MSPEFIAASRPLSLARPPALSRLLFFFIPHPLGRRSSDTHASPLRLSHKPAITAALNLGRAREAIQPVHPTINPPIMSASGVRDVRAIITYTA